MIGANEGLDTVSHWVGAQSGAASSVLTPCTHDAGGDLAVKDSDQQLHCDAVQSYLRVSTEGGKRLSRVVHGKW